MWKPKKNSLMWLGLSQAFGVIGYVGLVSVIFWKGNEWLGRMSNYWGPVFVLTLMSVSVLICGLIVFYKPYLMFAKKKKESAAKLVVYTAKWLVGILVVGILVAYARRSVGIDNFEKCVAAGNPVLEIYPSQCVMPDGRVFIEVVSVSNPPASPLPPEDSGVVCTMEARECPDGSFVGRTGPNCEFAPCAGQ